MAKPVTASPGRSLGMVFRLAEEDGDTRAFTGLTLLSFVCQSEGLDAPRKSPANLVAPGRRVGLRPPVNHLRDQIAALPCPLDPQYRRDPSTIYLYYANAFDLKPNSGVLSFFKYACPQDTNAITIIDLSGNYIGDKGVLPVLEVARHCPALQTLRLPANGLKNSAIEWIVDFALIPVRTQQAVVAEQRAAVRAQKAAVFSSEKPQSPSSAAGVVSPSRGLAAVASNSCPAVASPPPVATASSGDLSGVSSAANLTCLDVSGNPISLGAAVVLLGLLRSRPDLVSVNASDTLIEEPVLRKLDAAVAQNQQLKDARGRGGGSPMVYHR